MPQIHSALSCTEPSSVPEKERSARGDPDDREQGPVQDDVGVSGLLRVPDRLAELGARAASRASVWCTYLQQRAAR
jgi:hypothetical protein